jgi:hypothetical protein
MRSIEQLSFHESTLIGITRQGQSLSLELEDVHTGDGNANVVITMSGVRAIVCDGKMIDKFAMEAEEAEVLTLQFSATSMELIVEWPDFLTHKDWTRSYQFEFDELDVTLNCEP